MILRFRIIRPYLASLIFWKETRVPAREVARYLLQPGKKARASRFIHEKSVTDNYVEIRFHGYESEIFYYPTKCRLNDLYQTIDECLNEKNWHHFFSENVRIAEDDVVVDCGAAEGLFTFVAASKAKRVYAIEPVPVFVESLRKNFESSTKVSILPYAVGHRADRVRMSDDEIFSRIDSKGSLEIDVRTIDELLSQEDEPISLLKADIEGYEFPMLLGAEETIRRRHPKIALTVYHPQNNVSEIKDFLSRVHSDYRFAVKGIGDNGNPVLLQAW